MLFSSSACSEVTTSRNNGNNTKTVADVLNEAGGSEKQDTNKKSKEYVFKIDDDFSKETCDIDLTKMNSTMVYAEVNNMLMNPDEYIGKTVRMQGTFNSFEAQERNYYACIIADATACCAQGIEFVLEKQRKYPDEYPESGDEITVLGTFETYFEGEYKYCQLSNARLN